MMATISNREAYELTRDRGTVIVVCGGCGRQVWTDDSVYDEDADEWYCEDCCSTGPVEVGVDG